MGNKSKCNGHKQDLSWKDRRDLTAARQPKAWTSVWGGLVSPSAMKHARAHVALPKPVVHQLAINTKPQPWQKHAARLARKAA